MPHTTRPVTHNTLRRRRWLTRQVPKVKPIKPVVYPLHVDPRGPLKINKA